MAHTAVFFKMLRGGNSISMADIPPCPTADNPAKQADRMRELLRSHTPIMAYIKFIWPCFRVGVGWSTL